MKTKDFNDPARYMATQAVLYLFETSCSTVFMMAAFDDPAVSHRGWQLSLLTAVCWLMFVSTGYPILPTTCPRLSFRWVGSPSLVERSPLSRSVGVPVCVGTRTGQAVSAVLLFWLCSLCTGTKTGRAVSAEMLL